MARKHRKKTGKAKDNEQDRRLANLEASVEKRYLPQASTHNVTNQMLFSSAGDPRDGLLTNQIRNIELTTSQLEKQGAFGDIGPSRIGDKINIEKLDLEFTLFTGHTTTSGTGNILYTPHSVRVMLFWDNDPIHAISNVSYADNYPTWDQLLDDASATPRIGPMNAIMARNKVVAKTRRFSVIYDKSFNMMPGTTSAIRSDKFVRHYKRCPLLYTDHSFNGGGNGGTFPTNKKLYLAFISGTPATTQGPPPYESPDITYSLMATYTDA